MSKNEEFLNWFGDSKAINAHWEPRVYYHRSRSKEVFNEFKWEGDGVIRNPYNNHYGFFFVPQEDKKHISYIGDGIEVLVYLRMETPFWISDDGNGGIKDQDGKRYEALDVTREMVDILIERGFDSLIIDCPTVYSQFVVFNPNQIKSTENNGEFSTETNNIK